MRRGDAMQRSPWNLKERFTFFLTHASVLVYGEVDLPFRIGHAEIADAISQNRRTLSCCKRGMRQCGRLPVFSQPLSSLRCPYYPPDPEP
jgi:hypothetical protein